MKITTELCGEGEEEILIRCQSRTEAVRHIESVLQALVESERDLVLRAAGVEHYVPVAEILFFEAGNGKVYAHTATETYTTEYKLFELERILPESFTRISKSAIANIMQVSSLSRELVGNGKLTFANSDKITYFSRAYYHSLRTKIDKMRLKR